MRKLLKSFKTEISPTIEQKIKINKTIGTCRYVYNFYLDHNKTLYDNGEKFMTARVSAYGLIMSIFLIILIKYGLKKHIQKL